MTPFPRLPKANDLDEVLTNFSTVIDWSIAEPSGIGYFATMYKRATIAIDAAIENGEFDNGEVMKEFAKIFAQRYFDAINAYLQPLRQNDPSSVWQVHFIGLESSAPIVFQHLLTAVDAHINLDLGIAAASVGRENMDGLRNDFNKVNQVLGSQVQSVMSAIADFSPMIGLLRDIIGDDTEVFAINNLLVVFRDLAWQFALNLAESDRAGDRELIGIQDAGATTLGRVYLSPPGLMGWVVRFVAASESRDVAAIVKRLDRDSDKPAPTDPRFLRTL